MQSTPKITVLMSCYNAQRWLDDAITSVLNQTYRDFEFIIINDGSFDSTLDIIQKFAASDPRIVVITKPNGGLSESLNVGIEKARGEWIARLDADDICEPTRLEKQIKFASINSNVVFIGTGLTIIDEAGNKQRIYTYPTAHAALSQHLKTARRFPPHTSALYRTKTFRAVGGYRSRIHRAEDWDLWLRLSEVGEIACLSEPLVQIRKHSAQISHSEGGRRQLVDSRMAMISYWLRQSKFTDPVDAEKPNYEAFNIWVQRRLEEVGFFEYQNYKINIKCILQTTPRTIYHMVKLGYVCMARPILLARFLREQMAGESLTRRLAHQWIKYTQSCGPY